MTLLRMVTNMILYRKNKKFYSKLSLECLFFILFLSWQETVILTSLFSG